MVSFTLQAAFTFIHSYTALLSLYWFLAHSVPFPLLYKQSYIIEHIEGNGSKWCGNGGGVGLILLPKIIGNLCHVNWGSKGSNHLAFHVTQIHNLRQLSYSTTVSTMLVGPLVPKILKFLRVFTLLLHKTFLYVWILCFFCFK